MAIDADGDVVVAGVLHLPRAGAGCSQGERSHRVAEVEPARGIEGREKETCQAFEEAQPDDNRHRDGKDRQEDAACRSGKFHVNSILVNSIPGQTRCVGSATYKMS